MQADSASALATAYTQTTPGQTQMEDRAIEFPAVAVYDALLNAGDRLVGIIGLDRHSQYRSHFAGVTASLASGATIPTTSSTAAPIVGVIGEVRDATTSKKLVAKEYQDVIGISNMTLKQSPHWYYTDNTRIWGTRTMVADVVVWDKNAQLALMAASPRGTCPFPQDLHEALVCGALSYIFRGDFNSNQANVWRGYFNDKLQELGAHLSMADVDARKITD